MPTETQWQDIVHHAVVGIYRVTHEGRFIFVNPKLAHTFGYASPEEFLTSVSNITKLYLHPEDRPPILKEMNDKGYVEGGEAQFYRADGEIIWIRFSAWIIKEQAKETVYEGFMADITDQKHSEYLLKRSEERYRSLYQRTPVMLHSIDASGRLLSVSYQWLEGFGYAREEVIGRKITDFMTENSRRYAEAVVMPNFFKTAFVKDVPYQMVTKNGDIIDVLLSSTGEKDDTGKIIRTLAVMTDVTARRKAETELARYREHLEELVQMRTAELQASNRELLQEIVERKRVQQALQKVQEQLEERVEQRTQELQESNRRLSQEIRERKNVLDALRKSEERYRGIVETQTELICRFLPDGRLTFVNEAICKMMGMSRSEIISQSFYQYLHPYDREKVCTRIATLSHEHPIIENEERVYLPDGRLYWWHWTNQAMFDSNGNLNEIQAVGRDITAVKQAEAKVRESDAHIQSLTDSAKNFAVYRLAVDDSNPMKLQTVFVSPSIEDIMGISDKSEYRHWLETVHPEDLERVRRANARAFETNKFDEVFRIYNTPKDEFRWIHAVANGILDHRGQTKFVNGIVLDVTKQKQAEEALRESEQRFRQLVETMGEGLAVQDENGTLTYINESLCGMLGYSEKDLIGQPAIELFDRKRRRRLRNQMTRRKKGSRGSYDINMICKNGQFLQVMVSSQPILDSEGIYRGSFAVLTDISKLKKAEQALKNRETELETKTKNLEEVNTALRVLLNQRNEDKEELEEKVLHNVKELVMPYLEKLSESVVDTQQKSYIDILASNVNDIVSSFSRSLSAKYLNLTPAEIQIANLLKQSKTTKEIADMLYLSTRTVETHRKNIRKKLGLHNRKVNLRTHLLAVQ